MSGAEWTEAHRREATRRAYEIAAELIAGDDIGAADLCATATYRFSATEALWRGGMRDCGFDAARIDREVRRVRGLAEGGLIRTVTWRGESGEEYATLDLARQDQSHGGGRLTRVTRIRRA